MFKPSYVQFEKHPRSLSQVVSPGEDLPPSTVPAAQAEPEDQPTDSGDWTAIIGRLYHLPINSNAEQKKRDELGGLLLTLLTEAAEFEKQILARRKVELTEEWKKLRLACRKQSNLVRELEYKVQNAEAVVQSAIDSQDHAMTSLQAANDPRQLPAYATDAEEETMQTNIAKARKQADDASKELSYAINQRFQVQQELQRAQDRMAELGTAERRVRHALDGRQFYDGEFGISTQASS